ncbi:MAG: hypothetical protein CL525_12535 [Aequorivita sp.]|nr:hypothetical protein [Aequorivita sp.]
MESVNSVNVLSIDEERLKFRVIVGIDAQNNNATPQRFGHYKFELPPLTSFGNSNHYKQCTMKLDCISCSSGLQLNGAGAIPEAVGWSNGVALGKVSALEVILDVPSSGTLANSQLAAADAGTGNNKIGRFIQLIPLQLNLVGNSLGTRISTVGGLDIGTGSFAWQGEGFGEAMMCGNPFGGPVEIKFQRPDLNLPLALVDVGNAAQDVGIYSLQFTITMVHNK